MFEEMSEERILESLARMSAVITQSHVVYTSGLHGSAYVNKDAIYPHTLETANLCFTLALKVARLGLPFKLFIPEAVIGPALGGIILSQWTAFHFSTFWTADKNPDVLALYAERKEELILKGISDKFNPDCFRISSIYAEELVWSEGDNEPERDYLLPQDAELVIKRKELVLKRGYERRLEGKRVLIVEDILTTGNSARHAVEAARKAGGVVDIVAAICNGGELTAEQLGVSHLVSLLNFKRNTFPGNNCPLCNSGIPINTTVGHGKEFLEKQASKA